MFSRRFFHGFAPEQGHGLDHGHEHWHGHDPSHSRGHFAMRRGGRGGHHGHGHGHSPDDSAGDWSRGRGGFGRGGGGGRIFGPGDLRLMLLALIAEKPRHGYELIKEIEQKFGGAYSPSPGSIYPTLTLLEELEQVRASASDGARKLFEITDQGRAFLEENRATLDGVIARMSLAARHMSGRAWPESVHQAMHTLKHALLLRPGDWTESEATRVGKIIEQAVEAISSGRPFGQASGRPAGQDDNQAEPGSKEQKP
jgi:DNA-binding PadR family transcriptional regulator